MKKKNLILSILTSIFLMLLSCSKDDQTITTPMPVDSTESFKGVFVNSAHSTSGKSSVNNEKTKLTFTNFITDSGPNLKVYLASNISNINADYKDLGSIKGINGNYIYDLPTNIDYSVYKYVVIWCVDFNVNFGYSVLAP